MKLEEKDEGYAWIVVAASALVMVVGPSTYTSYASLFNLENSSYKAWILNLLFISWYIIAPLAGPLATINTKRKIVMFGLFLASCGLTLTGILLANPAWSILTFSLMAGIGIGIGVHETFLLVTCHFERHRGLAIGIISSSSLIGQIFSPMIYGALPEVKDRFYIRALMTAIAFMSASFYISPHTLGDLEEGMLEEFYPPPLSLKKIPKVGEKLSERGGGGGRKINSLPLIAEEAEISPGPNEKPDFVYGRRRVEQLANGGNEPQLLRERRDGRLVSNGNEKIKPLDPELVKKIERKISRKEDEEKEELKIEVEQLISVKKEKRMFRYRLDSIFEQPHDSHLEKVAHHTRNTNSKQNRRLMWRELFLELNWALLKNPKYLIMALCASLSLTLLPNFVLLLSTHTKYLNTSNSTRTSFEKNNEENVENILIILTMSDLGARLVVSFISDYKFFTRQTAFLVAALVSSTLVIGTSLIDNLEFIYIIAGVFGVCFGTLIVTESLMFLDTFGIDKLPSSYGFMNALKGFFILGGSWATFTPLSVYIYELYPFMSLSNFFNSTEEAHNIDFEEECGEIEFKYFLKIGVPVLLASILWIFEMCWSRIRSRRNN